MWKGDVKRSGRSTSNRRHGFVEVEWTFVVRKPQWLTDTVLWRAYAPSPTRSNLGPIRFLQLIFAPDTTHTHITLERRTTRRAKEDSDPHQEDRPTPSHFPFRSGSLGRADMDYLAISFPTETLFRKKGQKACPHVCRCLEKITQRRAFRAHPLSNIHLSLAFGILCCTLISM
jgi:hypothetical protein